MFIFDFYFYSLLLFKDLFGKFYVLEIWCSSGVIRGVVFKVVVVVGVNIVVVCDFSFSFGGGGGYIFFVWSVVGVFLFVGGDKLK